MNRDETVKKVVDYIKDGSAQYALLINGNWGCGKTYLYKNHLVKAINGIELGKEKAERKDNVYISLYGMSSLEDLSRALLLRFISVKTSKGTGDNEDIILKTAGVLEIISNSVSFQVKNVSVGGIDKAYKKILDMIKSKNLVICLDDLERCAIPVNEIFGWINNLTEHCNCKVIILADEENIGKMYANFNLEQKYQTILSGRRIVNSEASQDNNYRNRNFQMQSEDSGYKDITLQQLKELNEKVYSENYLYKDIKEKVIGETINYRPSIEETVGDLLKTDTNYNKYLSSVSSIIISEFSKHPGGVNYRTVIFWIKRFRKIYDECISRFGNDEYLSNMLEYFIGSSIASTYECKSHSRLIHTSEGMNSFVQYSDYGKKILSYSSIDSWIRAQSWHDSVFRRDCTDVRRVIIRDKHRNPNEGKMSKGQSLGKLSEWMYKSDQEVENTLSDVIKELSDDEYVFNDYHRILADIVFFSCLGFCSKEKIDTVISIMKENIKNSNEYCDINHIAPQHFESKEDQEKYNEYWTSVVECAKEQNKTYRHEEAMSTKAFKKAADFAVYCSDFYDTFYENKSFIGFVGKDEIIKLIADSNLEEKYIIIDSIERVYALINIKEYFSEDRELLEQLISELDNPGMFGTGKTDEYCKNCYIKVLKEIQERLR